MMKMEDRMNEFNGYFKAGMGEMCKELKVQNALNLCKMELEAGMITLDDYRKRLENIDKMYFPKH